MANRLYIPELNPVLFYDTERANLDKYYTKHFEKWMFSERGYFWEQRADYCQIWQTTDIIYLQFISNFDPIIVKLLDQYDNETIALPALVGLPNTAMPGYHAFEVAMSLASVPKGCYRMQIIAGPNGDEQKTYISGCMYISDTPISNSLLLEYWHSKFYKDVLFESGIQFQYRIHGNFGMLDKARKDEAYRDQRWNPALLNSKSSKQWPVYFGDHFGIPDDVINLIDEIWSCDNVLIDDKSFSIVDGSKLEYVAVDKYRKRGLKVTVEEGINRNSRVMALSENTNKKLMATILVSAKVFGDTANQASNNTVPIVNVE